MKHRGTCNPWACAVAMALLASIAQTLSAATILKANNTSNLNLSGSWVGGTVPTAADIALWTNTVTGANTVLLGAHLEFGQIRIANPGGNVTINAGNTLTLAGISGVGIEMTSATRDLTLNAGIILGGAQSWNIGSGRTLTLGGSANVTNNGHTLTIAGAGNTTIGTILTGSGGLVKAGTGTLTLNGANTYTGETILSNGITKLGNASALGAGKLTLSGGTNDFAGFTLVLANLSGTSGALRRNGGNSADTLIVGTDNTSTTFGGVLTEAGNPNSTLHFVKTGTGTLTLSGANNYSGTTTLSNGVLRLNHASALGSGNLLLSGGILGLGAGDFSRALGTGNNQVRFTTNGGFAAYGADRNVNLGAALTWASTANFLGNGATLLLGASDATHTITFANSINFNGAVRTIRVNDGAAAVDAVLSNALSGTGASGLLKAGAGTLRLSGTAANTYAGLTTVAEGELQLNKTAGTDAIAAGGVLISDGALLKLLANNQINNAAGVTNVAGGTLDLNGASETIGALLNSGTNILGGGTLGTTAWFTNAAGGVVIGPGIISNVLVNAAGGTVTVTGGTLALSNAPVQNGTVNLLGGGTLSVGRGWNNSGTLNALGGGVGGSVLTNLGLIRGAGDLSGVSIANEAGGTILASNGTLIVTLLNHLNQGLLSNLNAASTLQFANPAMLNQASIALNGGGLLFAGSVLTNQGTITGPGTLGYLLYNDAAGVVTAAGGLLLLSNAPTQNGTVNVAADGQLRVLPGWNNNGTASLLGGTVSGGTLTNAASGTVAGHGTISNAFVNAGKLVVTNGTLNLPDGFVQHGTATVYSTLLVGNSPSGWDNFGRVDLEGGILGGFAVSDKVRNNSGATLSGFGTISNKVINPGTVVATNGTLTLLKGVTQNGTILVANGAAINLGTDSQNNNLVRLLGGSLTGSSITNVGTIIGHGNGSGAAVVNEVGGTIFASNGTLSAFLVNDLNKGTLSVFNAGATLQLGNTNLLNQGHIGLQGGTLLMAGSIITNQGTITGPGTIADSLFNDTPGLVIATNGTLNVATNAGEFVENHGLFQIVSGGTLHLVPGWLNAATATLSGGVVSGGIITNTGLLAGHGTVSAALRNQGNVEVSGPGTTFGGAVSNIGILKVSNSFATFSNALFSSGRYISDPSTNTFAADVIITASGTLEGGPGDLFDFGQNLLIHSTNTSLFNLASSTVTFSGGGSHTNAITGLDLGAVFDGFASTNFAYGVLKLSPSDNLYLIDGDGDGGNVNALYVGGLDLGGSLANISLLHSSFNIYYDDTNPLNSYLASGSYALDLGGWLLPVPPFVIPEPSTACLLLASLALLLRRRHSAASAR